ncbi:lantibiotic dehydratase, partial [Streptomyces avidinii]
MANRDPGGHHGHRQSGRAAPRRPRTFSGVEAVLGANGGENVTLRATGAVTRALTLARTPIAYADLATDLLEAVPSHSHKVHDLLYRLWHHAFLLTDLRPPLTHLDPAGHVLDHLSRIPAAVTAAADLGELLTAIRNWEEAAGRPRRRRFPGARRPRPPRHGLRKRPHRSRSTRFSPWRPAMCPTEWPKRRSERPNCCCG